MDLRCPLPSCGLVNNGLQSYVNHLMTDHITCPDDTSNRVQQDLLCSSSGRTDPGQVKLHQCPKCIKIFSKERSFNEHMQAAHAETRAAKRECPFCDMCLPGNAVFNEHIRRNHKDELHCRICPEISPFNSYAAFLAHKSIHEAIMPSQMKQEARGAGVHQCRGCAKSFLNRKNIYRHEKEAHSMDPVNLSQIVCVHCGSVWESSERLAEHVQGEHGEIFNCKKCGKEIKYARSLRDHMKICPKANV